MSNHKSTANDCAQCGAVLFGCDLSSIATGDCGDNSPTSAFDTCLAQELASRRSKCRAIESAFRGDLWCKTLDALACFEIDECPRGLLHEAITSDAMVQLQSTTAFTIPDTFSAVFAVKYGFRDMISTSFSETTAEADLQTLLLAILSSRAEAVVSMTLSSDSSGYDAVAQISSMYYPNFELHIQVTSVNVPDSADMTWSSELAVGSFN
ncbi:hypothetical protein FI667_g13745, partial [Globisporangium splendens]